MIDPVISMDCCSSSEFPKIKVLSLEMQANKTHIQINPNTHLMSYAIIGQNLSGLWLMLVWNFDNVFAIQYVHDLYSICLVHLFFVIVLHSEF
jgi:hypothetical protein